jgi:phosphoserine phosphatase
VRLAIAMTGWALLVASCGAATSAREDESAVEGSSVTLAEPGWSAENRARVERALGAIRARAGRRVAVFDWDNTMMRGDIGDVVLAHVIERGLLGPLEPIDAYPLLTPAARDALAATGEPGDARDRVLAHVAWRGTTPDGAAAFTIPRSPFHRATYGFMAQLLAAGRTDEELRALALDAWRVASAAPVATRAEIGGVEVERFARLHAPMVELARALEAAGVEVFFVSASAQAIVEAMAEVAGFARTQVIGVRTERAPDGRATARFEACGEGALETPVTTWDEGKRCWINRVIFRLPPARQRARQDDAALRPVLAAGDSDGDHAMLEDATELRIVLDRGQPRVTASALADPARWILQPLFVDPAPR